MAFDIFVGIALVIILVLAVVAIVFLSRLDEIDTDDATVSVVTTATGASLANSPTVALQFVSPGNGVMMNVKSFTGTLVGANSILVTQTPFQDDYWPTFDLDFPILVENAGSTITGRMTVTATGILRFYAGLETSSLFTVGTVAVKSCGVCWTQDI